MDKSNSLMPQIAKMLGVELGDAMRIGAAMIKAARKAQGFDSEDSED